MSARGGPAVSPDLVHWRGRGREGGVGLTTYHTKNTELAEEGCVVRDAAEAECA